MATGNVLPLLGALLCAGCHSATDILDLAAGDASARVDSGDEASVGGAGYTGLYLYLDPTVTAGSNATLYGQYISALENPSIDGAVVIVKWSDIETTAEQYDWSALDEWLTRVVANHKKLSIGVSAGHWSPGWLSQAPYNVPTHVFYYNLNPAGPPMCGSETMPSPWDPSFVSEYGLMMAALSTHLHTLQISGAPNNAAYDALRIVKLGGINKESVELQVGTTRSTDATCSQSNVTTEWQMAGLTPQLILGAWNQLTQSISNAFPEKILSVDIISDGGAAFPPIDSNGDIYTPKTGTMTDAITIDLLNSGLKTYPGRFAVQWDGLTSTELDPQVGIEGSAGAITAWQLNEREGTVGGSGCPVDGGLGHCDLAGYAATIAYGMSVHPSWLELWAPNIVDPQLAPAIEAAHDALDAE